MDKKEQTYASAVAEIERILEKMESGTLEVDELSKSVQKVTELIQFCKKKLKQTEDSVSKILSDEINDQVD